MLPTANEPERLLDLTRGLYALLEPETPSEEAVAVARGLAGIIVTTAKGLVEHESAETRKAVRA